MCSAAMIIVEICWEYFLETAVISEKEDFLPLFSFWRMHAKSLGIFTYQMSTVYNALFHRSWEMLWTLIRHLQRDSLLSYHLLQPQSNILRTVIIVDTCKNQCVQISQSLKVIITALPIQLTTTKTNKCKTAMFIKFFLHCMVSRAGNFKLKLKLLSNKGYKSRKRRIRN